MGSKKILENLNEFEHYFWHVKDKKTAAEICPSVFDSSLIINSPNVGKLIGSDVFFNICQQWHDAFPGIKPNMQKTIVNNFIIVESRIECVHEGIFNGIKPTGKKVNYTCNTIYQFNENNIVNYVGHLDIISIYNQLGYFLQKDEYDQQHIIREDYKLLTTKLMEATANSNGKLTQKEIDVLAFWLVGYNLKEIGAIFNISPRTVESHIEHVKDKLMCHSKSDLRNLIHLKKIMHLFRDIYLLIAKTKKCF